MAVVTRISKITVRRSGFRSLAGLGRGEDEEKGRGGKVEGEGRREKGRREIASS